MLAHVNDLQGCLGVRTVCTCERHTMSDCNSNIFYNQFLKETNLRGDNNSDDNTFTIVLNTVGVDVTDVCQESISILIFVFRDVLLKHEIQTNTKG